MSKYFFIVSVAVCLLFINFEIVHAQGFSPHMVVDQFGYRPNAKKVAVLRNPQTGFDGPLSYVPGNTISVKNAETQEAIYSGTAIAFNGGSTDPISGDQAWWFDFSSVTAEGSYYIWDETNNARSATFDIGEAVFNSILKAAVKTFYYQRAGMAKTAQYAGVGWADGASHLKPLQDANCRLYNDKFNAQTEKDLSGGWYDAGDYNKYTPWTANYVVSMLLAYQERPTVWTDDVDIPESGNGIPDLLDEVKWGMDWLLKMNQPSGASLSIVGLAYASPPSAATGQSLYGPVSTNATLRSAAAFALGAKWLRQANATNYGVYADTLQARAIKAYQWGLANPSVIFNNNSNANGSAGLGAGNQETDSLGRFTAKMAAALYLYDLTGNSTYLSEFESGITSFPLIAWSNYISQYFQESQQLMFYYLQLPGINSSLATQVKNATITAANKSGDYLGAIIPQTDPYRAFIKDYNWGSNQYKSDYGNFLWQMNFQAIDPPRSNMFLDAAEEYLHYIHGVNPLQLVYLSNSGRYGAEKNIKEFYHSWFTHGSSLWDREGVSTYGPAPGFLAGGPNSSYAVDGCCPSGCGSSQNNAACFAESVAPPLGQPFMKSYKDFNTGWPLNSWQVTENSNGYQIAYIRLLSKFASAAATEFTATTIANGNWFDPTIWLGGKIPNESSRVLVKHAVVIPVNITVTALKIDAPLGNLTVLPGRRIEVLK